MTVTWSCAAAVAGSSDLEPGTAKKVEPSPQVRPTSLEPAPYRARFLRTAAPGTPKQHELRSWGELGLTIAPNAAFRSERALCKNIPFPRLRERLENMLFAELRKSSPSRYISFSRGRVPLEQVKQLVGELEHIGLIKKEVRGQWNRMMEEHNRILARGIRMGLHVGLFRASSMRFSSLDQFMLQMHCKYLANVLDDFTRFGERVEDLIRKSPNYLIWNIAGPIMIERRSWIRFSRQILSLLQTISKHKCVRSNCAHSPDHDLLLDSMERARIVFEKFTCQNSFVPSWSQDISVNTLPESPLGI